MLNLNIFEGLPVVKMGFDLEDAELIGGDNHDKMSTNHPRY